MARESFLEVKLVDPPTSRFEFVGFSNPNSSGDLNYNQSFTNQSSLTVTHNLGKNPSVFVVDSAGDEVEGDVSHTSVNELTIVFTSTFSGSVFCN